MLKNLLLGAAATLALASAAPAAVVITPFLGGPFSSLNPVGTLPATVVTSGNTYDFTFDLVAPLKGGVSATQVAAIANLLSVKKAELVQYQIYEGVPTTSDPEAGTLLATSALAFSPTVFLKLGVGDYYVNLQPPDIKVSGQVVSGSFVTGPAVPEPATWALVLMGAGLVGGATRVRRRLAA